jgi:hypothetical protein
MVSDKDRGCLLNHSDSLKLIDVLMYIKMNHNNWGQSFPNDVLENVDHLYAIARHEFLYRDISLMEWQKK